MAQAGIFVTFLTLLSLCFFSCSAGKGSGGNDPQLLTIFVGFSTGGESGQRAFHHQLEREFNDSHPDLHIQFLTVNHDEYATKFGAMLAEENAPDLVMPIGAQGVAGAWDAWLDLSPYVKRSDFDLGDFYEKAVLAQKSGDFLPSIPLGIYPSVLYYNSDMFDRVKLPYPPKNFDEPAWTWSELVKRAQKLTRDKNGKITSDKGFDPEAIVQYGWDGGDWSPLRAQIAGLEGENPGIDKDLKKATMNSPQWKAALHFIKDSIFTLHIRPRTAGGSTAGIYGDNDPLGSNKTAMWQGFSWMHYAWGAWNATLGWNVAAIPASANGKVATYANIEGISIPKAAKHPDLSWEVAVWLLKPEIMSRLSDSYSCIPARKSLAAAWLIEQKKINSRVDWQVFLDSIDHMEVPSHESWIPNYGKVWEAMQATLNGVTDGTISDTDQALETLNSRVQTYLDEYWKSR